MPRDYVTPMNFIVYVVHDEYDNVMYVGSSEKTIAQIEHNHRHFREEFPDDPFASDIRLALEREGSKWTFHALRRLHCSRTTAEKFETLFINLCDPKYNHDYYPYGTSVRRGRITKDIDEYIDPVVGYIKQLS